MSSDYVFLLSNASTSIYKNTLSNFKNDIFYADKRKIDEVALSEIFLEECRRILWPLIKGVDFDQSPKKVE